MVVDKQLRKKFSVRKIEWDYKLIGIFFYDKERKKISIKTKSIERRFFYYPCFSIFSSQRTSPPSSSVILSFYERQLLHDAAATIRGLRGFQEALKRKTNLGYEEDVWLTSRASFTWLFLMLHSIGTSQTRVPNWYGILKKDFYRKKRKKK